VATFYGVPDVMRDAGFVNVGLSNDAVAFVVVCVRRWWCELGGGFVLMLGVLCCGCFWWG